MTWDITNNLYDDWHIKFNNGFAITYVPKGRIYMTVDEPYLTIYWTDTEIGEGGLTRRLVIDFNDVSSLPASAAALETLINGYNTSGISGGGDVVGPASAIDDRIATFDGTTGKLIQDGGQTIAQIEFTDEKAQDAVGNSVGVGLSYNDTTGAISAKLASTAQTVDFTLALADGGSVIETSTAGSIKITIPTNASVAFPIGTTLEVVTLGTGLTYFEAAVGVTTHSLNEYLGVNGQHGVVRITKTGTNTWYLDGDLKAALDTDAEAYINAVGTFSAAEQGYINTWFLAAKAGGYYTKLYFVYLFLGGTASSNKFNAKNPLDTDGAFRMVFTGSPTHNSNGVSFNGSSQYGDTKFNPSVSMNQNSKGFAAYFRTTGTAGDFGAVDASFRGDALSRDFGPGTTYYSLSTIYKSTTPPATKTGFWLMNRDTSTNQIVSRNDSTIATDTAATSVNVNLNMYLGARNTNGTPGIYGAINCAFFASFDSLTSGQRTSMYNDCVQLQTDFGRNV